MRSAFLRGSRFIPGFVHKHIRISHQFQATPMIGIENQKMDKPSLRIDRAGAVGNCCPTTSQPDVIAHKILTEKGNNFARRNIHILTLAHTQTQEQGRTIQKRSSRRHFDKPVAGA
jgi:hypothetical protein